MFKKPKARKKKTSIRKRNDSDGEEDNNNNNHVTTKTSKSSTTEGDEEEEESTTSLLAQLKKQSNKKQRTSKSGETNHKSSSSIMHEYKSKNDKLSEQEMATRTAEHNPKEEQSNHNQGKKTPPIISDGLYHGKNEKRNAFAAGPLKAPAFVRTTCRFDYQPDICKDYKDTGFCGFGDTCIYLHDRGDTMSGWQLEQQWEERKKKERDDKERELNRFLEQNSHNNNDGDDTTNHAEDVEAAVADGIPFACHICRNPFKDPVVTSCGHYYCEKCIMERFQVNPCCPVCNKDMHGVFHHPQKLYAKKRKLVGRDASWDDYANKAANK